MIIPENAGLGDLRNLLAQAENGLTEWRPKLTGYRIDATSAKSDYEFELACAKVKYQDEKTPTRTNCKAATEPAVRQKQLAYKAAEACLIMGEDRVSELESQRDTLKCMIKSEQQSY